MFSLSLSRDIFSGMVGTRVMEVTVAATIANRHRTMARNRLRRRRVTAIKVFDRRGLVLNTKVVSWALGSFGAITFVLCVLYGLVVPESLHMKSILEQLLPAFQWLTGWGFLLGLVESFLYGAYTGMVFVPLYNSFSRRWAPTSS